MIAIDTNIMVYAHREELPQHQQALSWLTHLAQNASHWALPVFCLGEFARVVTHPHVFNPASSLQAALSAINGLLESPSLRILSPGPRYAELFKQALLSVDARGNIAFDAQVAAVCQEQGVTKLLTMDRDFGRFAFIKTIPLTASPTEAY